MYYSNILQAAQTQKGKEITLNRNEFDELIKAFDNAKELIEDLTQDNINRSCGNTLTENHETLREITFELDQNIGSILCRRNTLLNISKELGRVATITEDTKEDTTSMALAFYDIKSTIELLADLMHYTVTELVEDIEHTSVIKSSYGDLIVNHTNKEGEQ